MARKSIHAAEEKSTVDKTENNDNNQAHMSENQMSSDAAAADYSIYSRSRCGGALRTEREKQGLSVQDVAGKLKISSRQIESIEADQFLALPESTIVRGFIRNYAKLLKIDAEPLLDAYNVLVPSKQPLAFMLKPATTMKVHSYKKPKTGRYIVAGLLVLLVLGAWFFYQSYVQKPNPTLPSQEVIEPLPQPALPAAERAEQAVDLVLPAPEPTDVAPNANTLNTPAIAADNVAVVPEQAAIAPATEALPAESDAGMAKLEFNANQETWISIVDASGKQIYNKTIFAGSREGFSAKPPINVVIGNASGVDVSINNKPLNLGPHTRSNVARVKVDKLEFNQFE
ncbi:MAG: RodZ domain-containing protein [Pseudomonadota bacterium]